MSIKDYPEDVQRRVRAILDRAARRLLRERLADDRNSDVQATIGPEQDACESRTRPENR